jgi:nucleoside-diphosphate-sugar epimerase
MRILLTGVTGFVGERLLRSLVGEHEVYGISRTQHADLDPRVNWLFQDLAAPQWSVDLPSGIDAVVHLAQSRHFRDFPARADDIYGISAGATARLLDWSAKTGVKHFIFASTGGVYGASELPVKETDSLGQAIGPLGFYFATKRCGELLGMQYSGALTFVALRFFFVYGSGQPKQMLLPRLASNICSSEPILLQGNDGIKLNPIHVDDAVLAIRRCFSLTESRVINIAGPETVSLRAVAALLGHKLDCEPILKVDAAAKPGHLVADIGRMTRLIGAPAVGLDVGLSELLKDFT